MAVLFQIMHLAQREVIDSINDNEKLSIATLEARERAVELAKLLNKVAGLMRSILAHW